MGIMGNSSLVNLANVLVPDPMSLSVDILNDEKLHDIVASVHSVSRSCFNEPSDIAACKAAKPTPRVPIGESEQIWILVIR